MPEHTFVIPAYKQSPYLESCIQSLLGQSMSSTITLTTSTPSGFLETLAEKYGLNYHINPKSGSIAGDWNFALSKANTKFVTIAHQDDIYAPDYVAEVVKAINKNKDVLIAFTSYSDLVEGKIRDSSLNSFVKSALLWPFFFSKRLKSTYAKRAVLLFGDPISCPTVTFNMAMLNNDFAFSEAYSCALDWYAWLELSKREGSFLYINQKLVQHRIHPDSETTNQLSLGKRQKEEFEIFESMWGKHMARVISRLYAAGYKDNDV